MYNYIMSLFSKKNHWLNYHRLRNHHINLHLVRILEGGTKMHGLTV